LFGLYMVCHYLFKPHSYAKNKNNWVVKKSCWLFITGNLIYFHNDIQDVYSHWRQKEIDC
jgi:hypothetical protein